jgi:hypothetical protein
VASYIEEKAEESEHVHLVSTIQSRFSNRAEVRQLSLAPYFLAPEHSKEKRARTMVLAPTHANVAVGHRTWWCLGVSLCGRARSSCGPSNRRSDSPTRSSSSPTSSSWPRALVRARHARTHDTRARRDVECDTQRHVCRQRIGGAEAEKANGRREGPQVPCLVPTQIPRPAIHTRRPQCVPLFPPFFCVCVCGLVCAARCVRVF